jgi:hypothetical protein
MVRMIPRRGREKKRIALRIRESIGVPDAVEAADCSAR